MAHREVSVVSRTTRYDLLMCPFKVKRRREKRARLYGNAYMYRTINRTPVCIEVLEFLRGVTRREENGGFQKVERTRPTDQPPVRSFVSQVERYHRAERVHRCCVSNIDRTGMHYGVTQEEAVGDYGGCCGTGDGRDRTRCAPASLQD